MLADAARQRLSRLGYGNVSILLGDGFALPADIGDFDRIMVTAAMEQIPDALVSRLSPGGILIAPEGPQHRSQTLIRIVRGAQGFERKALLQVRFVPALPGVAREL